MNQPGRKPVVGGNWKMNTTVAEAQELARELVMGIGDPGPVDVIICPPFTNLQAVNTDVVGSRIQLGAQDVFWEEKGAFTGEISAEMLLSVGARWVICGHSERRHILGESSQIVNRKTRRALAAGLRVIVAVGETEQERREERTDQVLHDQLSGSLEAIERDQLGNLVIAYEPVWAIGTGLTASPEQAQAAHRCVRSWIGRHFGDDPASAIRIQYGGSVTAANAADLLSLPDIDGALVGGASLRPHEFAAIVQAVAPAV